MINLDPRKCGTEGNEIAHRRRNEPVCDRCRRGVRRAKRARRDKQIQAQGGPLPHYDEHCPRCGWFLKVEMSGLKCVNKQCSAIGVCW